jgi:putative transposase
LAAVLDLHSRAVVGWSMGSRMQTSLVLDALTMAVWRRKPKDSVIIHSGQGTQFGSDEFNRWCKDNSLSPSMSRRGNCWDNAVAESFFSNLKSEKIKKQIYQTRADAKIMQIVSSATIKLEPLNINNLCITSFMITEF